MSLRPADRHGGRPRRSPPSTGSSSGRNRSRRGQADVTPDIAGRVHTFHHDFDDRLGTVVEFRPQGPGHHRMLEIEGGDIGELEDLLVTQLCAQGLEEPVGYPTTVV